MVDFRHARLVTIAKKLWRTFSNVLLIRVQNHSVVVTNYSGNQAVNRQLQAYGL